MTPETTPERRTLGPAASGWLIVRTASTSVDRSVHDDPWRSLRSRPTSSSTCRERRSSSSTCRTTSAIPDTELESVLRNHDIATLVLGGVNADQCVLATLIDAACAGFDVILATDASATTSPSFCWEATIYNVRQCFGFTAQLADLATAAAATTTPPWTGRTADDARIGAR